MNRCVHSRRREIWERMTSVWISCRCNSITSLSLAQDWQLRRNDLIYHKVCSIDQYLKADSVALHTATKSPDIKKISIVTGTLTYASVNIDSGVFNSFFKFFYTCNIRNLRQISIPPIAANHCTAVGRAFPWNPWRAGHLSRPACLIFATGAADDERRQCQWGPTR